MQSMSSIPSIQNMTSIPSMQIMASMSTMPTMPFLIKFCQKFRFGYQQIQQPWEFLVEIKFLQIMHSFQNLPSITYRNFAC